MIFKTFESNIDKISSKWGIFGRSFNEIGTAITGRVKDINRAFQATYDFIGSFKDSDTIFKRLYPTKASIQSQLIDIDGLYPKINKNKFDFDGWIEKLNGIDKQVKNGTMSWQDYSNGLKKTKNGLQNGGKKQKVKFAHKKASLRQTKKPVKKL